MSLSSANNRLKAFFLTGTKLEYEKGQVALYAGDVPKGVYWIASGYIKVYSIRDTGDLNLHVVYQPGDLFPLLWAYRGFITNGYYEAMSDVVLYRASREQFRALVFGNLELAELMLKRLSEVHWVYANRVENLELPRAYDKVVYRLAIMADRFGKRQRSGEIIIQAPMTHKDIADSLNMIRETASREISKLEQEGLISMRDHRIVVLKPAALRRKLSMLKSDTSLS